MCCKQVLKNLQYNCRFCLENRNSMKPTKIKQRVANAVDAFFADETFSPGQIAVREHDFDLQNRNGDDSESVSFSFWAFAKCLFFYVPGVSLLYFVTLFLTYVSFTQIEDVRHFSFAFFWLGFGTFLMMFGIGKLANLKYLKVVAAVLVASFAVAFSFLFALGEMKGKFFGDSLYFLPIIILVGYLTKKRIDREEAELL